MHPLLEANCISKSYLHCVTSLIEANALSNLMYCVAQHRRNILKHDRVTSIANRVTNIIEPICVTNLISYVSSWYL